MGIIKEQYWQRGYTEVVTPNMYNLKLWETSGHAAKYKENMFCFDIESQEFGLKPMNCPGHCIMFRVRRQRLCGSRVHGATRATHPLPPRIGWTHSLLRSSIRTPSDL